MEMTAERRIEFERDGVVELGELVDARALADLRARLDAALFDAAGAPRAGVRDLSERAGRPRSHAALQVIDLHRRDEAFAALARRPDVVEAAEALLGPGVRLFRDQAFYKPPRSDGEIYLHQDNRYWHLDPPDAVTLWLALDDATPANGCLRFIRGSHRSGRIHHRRAAGGESILLEAETDGDGADPIEVPAGSATMHHCQTLHGSAPNTTDGPRRAHTMVFVAAGVRSRRTDLPEPVPLSAPVGAGA